MKLTFEDGTVFEGTFTEYEELHAFTHGKAIPAVEAEEQAPAKPKLKAGDFVKITRRRSYYDNDKVYEVIERHGALGVIDEVGDFVSGFIRAEEYELVDAETTKWAKLGRKVNEYKKGDIIEITKDQCGNDVGSIVKVVHIDRPHNRVKYRKVSGRGTYLGDFHAIKLVAPVESLFTQN